MQTLRRQLIDLLEQQELDAKTLSKLVKVQEKEVYFHLDHIRRSLKPLRKKLIVHPFQCMKCDYVFEDRKRLDRPGRCPQCKDGHISMATFHIR